MQDDSDGAFDSQNEASNGAAGLKKVGLALTMTGAFAHAREMQHCARKQAVANRGKVKGAQLAARRVGSMVRDKLTASAKWGCYVERALVVLPTQ
eukprot:SAG11_NODE_2740_length_3022_cov_2.199795_7_plen_95_part_00